MKVLWLSPNPCNSVRRNGSQNTYGGWMQSLQTALANVKGLELEIAFLSDKREEPFIFDGVQYYPVWNGQPSNPLKRVLGRYFERNDRKDSVIVQALRGVIANSKPDIIHIHGTEHPYSGIIPYLKGKYPFAVSIQGMLSVYVEKYFSGIDVSTVKRCSGCYERIRKVDDISIFRNFSRRASAEIEFLENTDNILGRTDFDRRISKLFNPDRKYFVVNEVLRIPFFKTNWKHCRPSGKVKVVSTISSGMYKGLETLLKSASKLDGVSGFDYEWIIAGLSGSEKYVSISSAAAGLEVSPNIRFSGLMDGESLATILAAADVYVQVSHVENSPNALCEAMLVGLPIVASFAGGTSSMMEDKKEGLLVQDGDSYSIASAIMEICDDFETASVYADAARERAFRRHNPESVVNELMNAYSNILSDFKKADV